MIHVVVGNCQNCGAPIHGPAVWNGIGPAPTTYTCACMTTTRIPMNTPKIKQRKKTDEVLRQVKEYLDKHAWEDDDFSISFERGYEIADVGDGWARKHATGRSTITIKINGGA